MVAGEEGDEKRMTLVSQYGKKSDVPEGLKRSEESCGSGWHMPCDDCSCSALEDSEQGWPHWEGEKRRVDFSYSWTK